MNLKYSKHERVSLKNHATLSEQWLQDRIAEDPTILGLGDLAVIERERSQYNAGRIDLLLSDGERRFEVELQLGKTDASHIIRTIEYWDIERRRYPGYDHCAVIVAEDITSRFLNVIGLFAGSIPLVAIQLSAIRIGDQLVLHFSKVLDQRDLRVDDENREDEVAVDRSYWEARASAKTLEACDALLGLANEEREIPFELTYLKRRIRFANGGRPANSVWLFPRKQHVRVLLGVADAADWIAKCEDVGLDAELSKRGHLRFNVSPETIPEHRELLANVLRQAIAEGEP